MNSDMIEQIRQKGVFRSEHVEKAFNIVNRIDFVGEENKALAYSDSPLPIGYDQTISQPATVAFMLEIAEVKEGNIVLEAGSGSGWQTALLAQLVGEKGHVHSFEIIEELCDFGKKNLEKYPDLVDRVTFYCESAEVGTNKIRTDRVISAAELNKIPKIWRDNLKFGGILVYPKDHGIYREVKLDSSNYKIDFYPGFRFVPFIYDEKLS